jgi:hypothetical protein
MPKRLGRQQMARRRGLRDALRRAARRGLLDEDEAARWLEADLGFSAEEMAKLVAESLALRGSKEGH